MRCQLLGWIMLIGSGCATPATEQLTAEKELCRGVNAPSMFESSADFHELVAIELDLRADVAVLHAETICQTALSFYGVFRIRGGRPVVVGTPADIGRSLVALGRADDPRVRNLRVQLSIAVDPLDQQLDVDTLNRVKAIPGYAVKDETADYRAADALARGLGEGSARRCSVARMAARALENPPAPAAADAASALLLRTFFSPRETEAILGEATFDSFTQDPLAVIHSLSREQRAEVETLIHAGVRDRCR